MKSKYWTVLLISAGFEAIWATALSESHGFSKLWPTLIFVVTAIISMLGLGYAMKALPISVAYAVWTGIGAALTVLIAVVNGREAMGVAKFCFLAGIIACVIGLKMLDSRESKETRGEELPA